MSNAPRLPRTLLRRGKEEPDRPDYQEPDFSSWAAKLDEYIPAHHEEEVVAAAAAPASANEPASLNKDLEKLLAFDGAMSVGLVDSDSGMVLGKAGSGIDMDRAAASASMILRARRSTIKALSMPDDIDDLLITLSTQLHIIRPMTRKPTIFIYLIVDKTKASLAMARYKVTEADEAITI
jgi:hypothetical protein